MQPQLAAVESRLAAVLIGEMLRSREHEHVDLDDTFVDIPLMELEWVVDEDNYYHSFEICAAPPISDVASTIKFVRCDPDVASTSKFARVRDTTHDHIPTVKFARESLDAETLRFPRIDLQESLNAETLRFPLPLPNGSAVSSTPYERIDIQDCSYVFARVDRQDDETADETDDETDVVIATASTRVVVAAVLCSALVVGVLLGVLFAI